jgi:hypothetical protein
MKALTFTAIAGFFAVALAGAVTWQARAGGELVKFPEEYAKGQLYGSVDRTDIKEYREFYTSQAALDAVKKGQPIPSGTVITMVHYKAKLDEQGSPLKDANGRLVKGELSQYGVMEKRTGWGAEYPAELRNGEWEYQTFKADKSVNDKADLKRCFGCHKPKETQDFVFSFEQMKVAK